MKIGKKGISLIQSFESLRLKAYDDGVGVPTIGWGHTKGVKWGDTCTKEQADQWLLEDLAVAEKAVNAYVKVDLSQGQYDALVSFTFNVGTGALKSSTLLKKLNAGDYLGAADEFPRWNKGGGKVMKGLTRRRAAERELFLFFDGMPV